MDVNTPLLSVMMIIYVLLLTVTWNLIAVFIIILIVAILTLVLKIIVIRFYLVMVMANTGILRII